MTARVPRLRVLGVALVAAVVVTAAACGSDSSGSSNAAASTTTNPATNCPFSGTTNPTNAASSTDTSATLTKVTPSRQGCIDNVQFDFAPGVPAWSVGYQPGPFTDAKTGQPANVPGSNFLVVAFQGVGASNVGSTAIQASSLNYVTQVTLVAGANGTVEWVLSLDQKLAYQTSSSKVPAYFVLSVG
jgi:hypothetical protein